MGTVVLFAGEGLDQGLAGPAVQNENEGPLTIIKKL